MSGFRMEDLDQQPPYLYAGYRSTLLRAPSRPLIPITQTLSETTGPLFGAEVIGPGDDDLTRPMPNCACNRAAYCVATDSESLFSINAEAASLPQPEIATAP